MNAQVHPIDSPVLLGDRLAAARRGLGPAAPMVALQVAVGLLLLVAGLRPVDVTFADAGATYSATCGIETVVVGSSWSALDDACRQDGGLRVATVLGGLLLMGSGTIRSLWSPLRAARSFARPAIALPATALAGSVLVGVGAAVVDRARLEPGAVAGACETVGACGGSSGAIATVLAGALVVGVLAAALLARALLPTRSTTLDVALGLLALAVVLLAVASRPVDVVVEDGDDALRASCGLEVLVAGHPRSTVESACRSAAGGRGLAAVAAVGAGIAGGVVGSRGWRARPTAPAEGVPESEEPT